METLKNLIVNIKSEHIALLSIIVTVLLYVLSKNNELKLKKHELKKEKYLEFIQMLENIHLDKDYISNNNEDARKKFFEFGSTIFIYGSKKMYKKYCFFREITCDFVKKTKYYDKDIPLYLGADMLNQIRKEIGLYSFERSFNFSSIAFFTNDIYFNPNINVKWWKYKIKVFLIKFEIYLYKVEELTMFKIIIEFIKLPFKILSLLYKFLIMIPLGRMHVKFGFVEKLQLNVQNKSQKK